MDRSKRVESKGPLRGSGAGAFILALAFAIVAFLAIYFLIPQFFNIRNLKNILVQSSTLGLMAIGMTFVYLLGGMDLSIPAVMAFSGIMGAIMLRSGIHPIAASVLTLLLGGAVGAVNGISVAFMRMIPFVVTLAMMQVMSGISTWMTNSVSVAVPLGYIDVVLFKVGGLPIPVYLFILLAGVSTFFCKSTIYGRWLYAIGTNLEASRVCGIRVKKVVFATYVGSGLFAGLTGILLTARLGAAGPLMGSSNVILDVMSAAVVGGVSIYGGVGSPMGAALGAVAITILNNVLNLLRVDFFPAQVIKGVIVIAFVALDSIRRSGDGRRK
jgi:ribose/xylose/arabinose/galactoside ABC-type transport system permease subunit